MLISITQGRPCFTAREAGEGSRCERTGQNRQKKRKEETVLQHEMNMGEKTTQQKSDEEG